MDSFTFLHAADLHLDTPFEGLSKEVPSIAAALRDASLLGFDRLVDLALREEVAFVLFAGDIYDGPERGLRAQLRFLRGLEKLSAAGILSFLVHGNHDPVEEGWKAIRDWPDGVHVFGPKEVEEVPLVRDGAVFATVYGRSFGRRAERSNLARGFRRNTAPGFHVGLLHANVGGQPGHDDYAPCGIEDLRRAALDYWALGHVHLRQTLLEGEVWAAYPGNLQGRGFKPSERGSKGVSLVHVEGNAVQRLEHRSLAPIRFESIQVDTSGLGDLPAVERALLAAADALGGEETEGLLISAELVGRTALHSDLLREQEELRRALDDATLGNERWIHWPRLTIRTAPPVERETLAGKQDLLGTLLRQIDRLRDDEDGLQTLLSETDKGLDGLRKWRDVIDDTPSDLLSLVEQEALDTLLEEG